MDNFGVEYVSVNAQDLEKKEREAKKKEKKKRKKESKDRKTAKKEEAKVSSESDAEMQNIEDQVGEYDAPETSAAARDDWMTAAPSDKNILTGERLDEKQSEGAAEQTKPKISAKELNPVMAGDRDKLEPSTSKNPSRAPQVGDGGASWRLKALKRAQALAKEEGRPVDEIVSDRHGSLAKLTEQLTTQRAAHSRAHLHAQRDRQREKEGEPAGYLQEVGSGKSQMRRPDPSRSMSWRRGSRTEPDRRGNPQHKEHQSGETAGARHRHDEGRKPRDPLGRPQDATSLRAAAAALNTFQSDGSFMDTFKGQGGSSEPAEEAEAPAASTEESERPATEDVAVARKMDSEETVDVADVDNKSAAAALRARLLGKSAQKSTEAAGKTAASRNAADAREKQVELLPSVDAEGRAVPGAHGRRAIGHDLPEPGRKPKKIQRYDNSEKQRYYADDDHRSLEDLVREQRHGGGSHMDDNLADNIARKARFRERDLDVDDEYDVDGGLEMYENRNSKVTKDKAAKRHKSSQIADFQRTNRALDNCNLCFNSSRRSKHLTIAIGQTAYLCLPQRARLAPLHCCIVPMEHVASSRKTDEHVWTEMRNFKKCIIQMFMAQGLQAIFYETATKLTDLRSHAIVHCIPVPDKAFHRGSIVFRKALQEAESEWSQHNAKAVMDTKVKGLRGSVPPNFPYFFVEFGLSEGQLHVIDDEESFDRDFGRSVLAGLLQLGAEVQHRGARPEPVHVQQKLAADFSQKFEAYDWTKQLD